jgi:hypothetical protein
VTRLVFPTRTFQTFLDSIKSLKIITGSMIEEKIHCAYKSLFILAFIAKFKAV